MPWGELVHITATYFRAGEHPWTPSEFYRTSFLPHEAKELVNPIILTLSKHEGPRHAPSWNWWDEIGDLWSVEELPLDAEYRLTADVVRFELTPFFIGLSTKDDIRSSLIQYEIDGMGKVDTFRPHLSEIRRLCDRYAGIRTFVSLMTLWACDADKTYIPGEPDEYYTDYQLIGVVAPRVDTVAFEMLPETLEGEHTYAELED